MRALPGSGCFVPLIGVRCLMLFLIFSYFQKSFLPGQEAGNVDVVLEDGYGDYCDEPSEIAQEVGFWLQDEALLRSMSVAAQKSGRPYAADEIVHDIGCQTVAWMNLNER